MKNRSFPIMLGILVGVVALTTLLIVTYRQPIPEVRALRGKQLLSANVAQAAGYLESGRVVEAENYLKLALKEDPADPVALPLLGLIYYETGRYEEAVEVNLKLIELNADDAAAYGNLGQALFRLGRNTEALNAYKTSLSLNPDSIQNHRNIAWVYSVTGERLLAQQHQDIARQLTERRKAARRKVGQEQDE